MRGNKTTLPAAAMVSIGVVVVVISNVDVRKIRVEVVERVGQRSE
jgi:hypothetical protein